MREEEKEKRETFCHTIEHPHNRITDPRMRVCIIRDSITVSYFQLIFLSSTRLKVM